jgi:uncharacterized repeat protein (TIGR01451 family)
MYLNKNWSDGSFFPGNEVTYSIYWRNQGATTAQDVYITDTLPVSLTYVSHWSESYTPNYTNTLPALTIDGNLISWGLGDIEAGWYGHIYLTAEISPDAFPESQVTNQAEVSVVPGETDTSDNASSQTDTILTSVPDMYLYKYLYSGSFYPGNDVTYSIYWSNQGATTAQDVHITDTLPVSFTYVSHWSESYTPNYTNTLPAPTIDGNVTLKRVGMGISS